MPAIIRPQDYAAGLDPELKDIAAIRALIGSYASDPMQAWPVSAQVNDARSSGAQLLAPSESLPAVQRELF